MPSRIGAAALRNGYALACVFSWAGGSHARAQRSESLGSESLVSESLGSESRGSESYPRMHRFSGPYIHSGGSHARARRSARARR